jgi:hypothetical protein
MMNYNLLHNYINTFICVNIMIDEEKNLKFSLHEDLVNNNKKVVTYEEIYENVEKMTEDIENESFISNDYMEDFTNDFSALELEYKINFTKKELSRIVDYYGISKRKKNKQSLIDNIIIFESDETNLAIVLQRKKLWECIKEIKADKYLSKFLILD